MSQPSAIGAFTFVWMSQPMPHYRRDFVFEAHQGVDGHAIWDTGERGYTFTVHTMVDVVDYTAARVLLEAYQDAQRSGVPASVVWANIAEPREVLVQDVQAINGTPKAIAGGVGGTYVAGMARAKLEASWRLHQIFE